ncbi:MAG TPA: potassium channel family protein [Anaeromyxobacteraceae bacterium]|nr:potassium channel family protein [Anaeromyxobacteraceae bacterium]
MVPRRLLAPLAALVATVGVGTAGYWLLFGGRHSLFECAYMTVTTVSTVGFGEILPVAEIPLGRPFTLALVVTGTVFLWWFMASVTAFLVEAQVLGLGWRRRMDTQLSRIRDHVVVCGAGSTGIHAIRELAQLGTPFVVVDAQEAVALEAARAHGAPAVVGDATHDEVLERAGIARARGIISALTDDKDNLFVTVTARALNPKVRIVAKAIDGKAEPKLRRAGADSVVSPNAMGGLRMVSDMLRPEVTTFLDTMLRNKEQPLHIAELPVPATSPWVGRPVADLDLGRRGLLLLAAREPGGRFTYSPPDDAAVTAGAVLILLGPPGEVGALSAEVAPR